MQFKNEIYKAWDGRICDRANDLFLYEADGTIHDRHERFEPVPVTSSVWNAMRKACAIYNAVVSS
jgi:hypothetical protein